MFHIFFNYFEKDEKEGNMVQPKCEYRCFFWPEFVIFSKLWQLWSLRQKVKLISRQSFFKWQILQKPGPPESPQAGARARRRRNPQSLISPWTMIFSPLGKFFVESYQANCVSSQALSFPLLLLLLHEVDEDVRQRLRQDNISAGRRQKCKR